MERDKANEKSIHIMATFAPSVYDPKEENTLVLYVKCD